uniref:Uncharacterized protein n=1 Tax=Eutreptiella gymnastica TaxID=73025 RepID=A0A7S1I0N4_9EUGL
MLSPQACSPTALTQMCIITTSGAWPSAGPLCVYGVSATFSVSRGAVDTEGQNSGNHTPNGVSRSPHFHRARRSSGNMMCDTHSQTCSGGSLYVVWCIEVTRTHTSQRSSKPPS